MSKTAKVSMFFLLLIGGISPFFAEDIKNEADAKAAYMEVEDECIEASECITRNKRNMIARAEKSVRMLLKKCRLRKWKEPVKKLEQMMDRLVEAKMEMQGTSGWNW